MKIEVLIAIYMIVCFAMIGFNCVVIAISHYREKNLSRIDLHLEKKISAQMERLSQGQAVDDQHISWLCRKLKRVKNLTAFDLAMGRIPQDDTVKENYIISIYSVFRFLMQYYSKRDDMELTYYMYLLDKYRVLISVQEDDISRQLSKMVLSSNIYCREQALRILYQKGDAPAIVEALLKIDQAGLYHNAKLIHDGFQFAGDKQTIEQEIWKYFPRFTPTMKVAMIQYFRLSATMCPEQILLVLMDEKEDDEVRFSAMRYFGSITYEPAAPVLVDFLRNEKERRWEYVAIAASVLYRYPDKQTTELLMTSLSDPNWYIRSNAAKTLVHFEIPYVELIEIFEGKDRFAREILQYWLDHKEAELRKRVSA